MGHLEDDLDYSLKCHRVTEAHEQYLDTIFQRAVWAVQKAVIRFPQPNYVLTKIAEEAGEVVKAGVHYAEGRDFTWKDLEGECVQTIAMCLRLLIEGDQVIGITPPQTEKKDG